MAEYIEREKIFPNGVFFANENDPLASLDELIERIWSVPAADVAPVVHGRWEVEIDFDEFWGDLDYYKCSVCGNMELRDAQTPYCPHCGARMCDPTPKT